MFKTIHYISGMGVYLPFYSDFSLRQEEQRRQMRDMREGKDTTSNMWKNIEKLKKSQD